MVPLSEAQDFHPTACQDRNVLGTVLTSLKDQFDQSGFVESLLFKTIKGEDT